MSDYRRIVRLEWAERAEAGPFGKPKRVRGAKAAGIRYEKLLAKALPGAEHGVWWKFRDSNGGGYCQTDLILAKDNFALVLEAKYTWTPAGHGQIEDLYSPVLGMALARPVKGIVVCRNLLPNMPSDIVVTTDPKAAGRMALAGLRVVLHWTGFGPLGT